MDEKQSYTVRVHPRKKSGVNKSVLISSGFLVYLVYLFLNSYFAISTSSSVEDPKKILLDALKINLSDQWLKKYTSEPHLPGTNYGLVEWTRQKFEEYGFKSTVDTYDIYVSYPNEHDLNLLNATTEEILYKAPLKEDELEEDETTKGDDLVPTFLSYAANGNVTAQYVYVNYGTREDFEKLKSLGVDVKGKIAVIRYGSIFRGLKVKFAQENGAIGVLLYTDPGEDYGITPANGYKQYPNGPARHESSVQRGSVQFLGGLGSAPGDPTTPGYASKPGVERQDPHASIGKIPVLPISYREVKPILEKLNGHGVKIDEDNWVGELEGFDYYTGPNKDVTLNLYNNQIYNITPLWNVYGEIEGENKDEVIVIGNHRDAWIKGGAGDPNSGSATLLEVARAFGALKASGYKFKRSIILQSFDGEEYGLLGSTEQGEFFAKQLKRKVVAYFNLDVAVSGKYLHLGASPVLNSILRETAKELEYPESGVGTLYDHFVKETGDNIKNLGSGSDYTVYLEHLGIPSVDFGFSGGKGDPIYQYHSNYDSYHWMSQFADKDFVYHNLAAKFLGLATLKLNERELIKFKLEDYSNDLIKYYNETIQMVPSEWYNMSVSSPILDKYLQFDQEDLAFIDEASNGYYETNSLYPFPELLTPRHCKHSKVFTMYDSSHHKHLTVQKLIDKTFEDIFTLRNATEIFDIETMSLQAKFDNRDKLSWWQRIKLHFQIKYHNKLLQYFERNFLYYGGLCQRPWFKHIVFASGRWTGYAGQTFPGLKEAIEDDNLDSFVGWLGIVSKAIRRVSSKLNLK